MNFPQFTKTIVTMNTQGKPYVISYTESSPFYGMCAPIPSTVSMPQALPFNMFTGASVQDVLEQATKWIG
ncbi:hypothetical protein [Sulfobacillus thermosulfidooxidans]|uniref:hypothetical protein n=1 Tax=Sulfobacillus thermosulfidooxidans TaxID=28034 RepID=UPI0006B61B52|nr:hypothetical protein [Sulfobacillus thermosulfidooxidans]